MKFGSLNLFAKTASAVRRVFRSEDGAILPIAALLLPVLVLTAAVSIEYSRTSSAVSGMQNVVDAALMAAAVHVDDQDLGNDPGKITAELQDTFNRFMQANLSASGIKSVTVDRLEYDSQTGSVVANVSFDLGFAFYPIDDVATRNHAVESSIGLRAKTISPISMMFVLDKSGSMRGTRIAALKVAVDSLTQSFIASDPETKYVRTGVSFYDSSKRTSTKPDWGVENVKTITAGINAGGGTNSSGSMSYALAQLTGNREEIQHSSRNSGDPRKVILFLTDGNNNRSQYDTKTLKSCQKAKAREIDVYAVAFQAPSKGRALLKACATSEEHYFDANSANELIAVFSEIGQIESGALSFNR